MRASQKLAIAARMKLPNAIDATATSASLVALRAAASIDVSVYTRAAPDENIVRMAYSSLPSIPVPVVSFDATRSRATSSGTVRATTALLTVTTTPAVERFESSCA